LTIQTLTTYRKKWAPFYIACTGDVSPTIREAEEPSGSALRSNRPQVDGPYRRFVKQPHKSSLYILLMAVWVYREVQGDVSLAKRLDVRITNKLSVVQCLNGNA
jgi:hypothetical protein